VRTPLKTVLVIEDNAIAREGLSVVLRRHGYRIAMAADGGEALAYLQGARPDLILLDMLMPGVDGWQFLEEMRRLPLLSSVPVIITTGSIITRAWALDHGATGFLKKPFDEEDLLNEIQRCCSS